MDNLRRAALLNLVVCGVLGILAAAVPSTALGAKVPTRAGQQYLEIRQTDGSYQPIFVKGVNLSVALPGHHPSEFPQDEALYLEWLEQIAAMNCNTVRIYTIFPPKFYDAFYSYNTSNPDKPLYLIQGVWVTAPPEGDFLAEEFITEVEMNLMNAVNLIHGNANFDDRPGWTGGRYRKDVSRWLLAWLLGREWEPDDIQGFQKLYPNYTSYKGTLVSCPQGDQIEAWFARICDYTVTYEDKRYGQQHPVTFSSWPPTDPLTHMSESNIEDEEEMAGAIAEGRVEIFSNDAVNISSRNMLAEPEFKAGLYASYHIYPYWPDFLYNEVAYGEVNDRFGPSHCMGYLEDLKAYYDDRPLLVAEYGLPNGPCPAHLHPEGWHHGGLTEAEVAKEMPRLTYALYDSGCAGGVAFAWMDEWFKKVWLWAEFYDPWMDRRMWFNSYDSEQNYGMLAIRPGEGGPTCSLTGASDEWAEVAELPGMSTNVADNAPVISKVEAMHDEGFFILRLSLSNFDDWEFIEHGLYLGFDVLGEDEFGDDRGNLAWPGPLNLKTDVGLEEVLHIASGEARLWQTESFRFWNPYPTPNSPVPRIAEVTPHFLETEDNRWAWFEPTVEVNARRVGRDGNVFEAKSFELNPLPRGTLTQGPEFDSGAVWNVDAEAGVVEISMPWILLGFVGPHQMRVIQSDDNFDNSSEISPGIGVSVVLSSDTGYALSAWPGYNTDELSVITSASGRYAWEEWGVEDITYHTRLKDVYYSMQRVFGELDVE